MLEHPLVLVFARCTGGESIATSARIASLGDVSPKEFAEQIGQNGPSSRKQKLREDYWFSCGVGLTMRRFVKIVAVRIERIIFCMGSTDDVVHFAVECGQSGQLTTMLITTINQGIC